jgi:PadR family transcriptional regulator, regulatory protein PadR
MRGEVLKGHLDLLLLSTVADSPRHGYAIVEELRRRSSGLFGLSEGTVYPALYRLERAGLLESRWSQETGRRRRLYSVTRRGRAQLERLAEEWRSFSRGVEEVLAWAT